MKIRYQILGVALLALSIQACKNTDYKKTKDGLTYKVYNSGSGDKIAAGNVVRYHMTNKLEDSLLGSTY